MVWSITQHDRVAITPLKLQERTHPELTGFVASIRPRVLDLVREQSLLLIRHLRERDVGDIEKPCVLVQPIRWVNRTGPTVQRYHADEPEPASNRG